MGKFGGLAWLLTSTVAICGAANAQTSANAPVTESARQTQTGDAAPTEEIVVTAQKRSERLIDVPQAVSVLSADQIARSGASELRDLAATVPGLSLSTRGAGENQVSLRGVTTGGVDVSATVGTYVDEVPYGSSTAFGRNSHYGADGSLYNVSRIEVLRGPQGTLYGASSMGGILKYVTVEPDPAGFGGDFVTGVSSTEHGGVSYNGALALNLPLTDVAALRVSGFYTHDGGYIDNVANNAEDVNRANLSGLRVDFLLEPTSALSIRIVAEGQDIHRDGSGSVDYTSGPNGQPVIGELSQTRPIAETFDQSFRLFSGTINYEFERATLTSISSYQEIQTDNAFDSSANYVPLLASFGLNYGGLGISDHPRTEKFTEELRLASSGHNAIDWILGAFYTREDGTRTSEAVLEDTTGAATPNFVAAFGESMALIDAPSTYEETAVFGDLTVHLTDRLDVTAGLRYSDIDQTYNQTLAGVLIEPFTGFFPASSQENVTTYLANARYRISDHSTAYFRYATGYRPGGPNFVALPSTPPTFKSDSLQSYELGYKVETDDRAYSLEAAVFRIDWDDIQIFDLTNPLGGFANSGGAEINGVELAIAARPLEGLTFNASLAYQDATLNNADPQLYAAKGDDLPNVPHWSAALDADYLLSSEGWQPTLGASVHYVSDRQSSFSLSPQSHELPAYTTLDLRAGATFAGVDAQLFVHNATDERAELSAIAAGGRPAVAIQQPRTIGVSLRRSF